MRTAACFVTKKMANAARARHLLEASQLGSVALLKEMKTIKGSKKSSCNLPDNVAGVSGEQLIVEEFRSVYSALYNSFDTSQQMEELKAELNAKIGPDSILEVDMITGEAVKKAAARMKPDKRQMLVAVSPAMPS